MNEIVYTKEAFSAPQIVRPAGIRGQLLLVTAKHIPFRVASEENARRRRPTVGRASRGAPREEINADAVILFEDDI